MLTVNAPIGLGFRDNPGDIINRASTGDGLEVLEGQNISLIGGNVTIENGGIIFAPGGRVELGGLLEAGTIDIAEDSNFSFPDGVARSDVSLTDSSIVAVFSGEGGSIGVNAANLEISSGSRFLGGIRPETGSPSAQAGDIIINTTDSVLIDGQGDSNTGIFAEVRNNSIGNAGDINILTGSFTLSDAAQLNNSTSGVGNAGNIFINARNSIVIDGQEGSSFNTNILTSAFSSSGNAGNINLIAESIALNNGATLAALGDNQSSAGDITIQANDKVSLANQSNVTTVTGSNGGSLTIDANSLEITSGSNLSAGINLNSGTAETQAGDITINVIEDVLIDGLGENIQTQTNIVNSVFEGGEGRGGNITINAQNINFQNGGNLFSFNGGQASLGNITLTAIEDISFEGVQGSFRSGVSSFIPDTGTGDVGSIEISAQNLTISNGANIQSLVSGMATSRDINIDVIDTITIEGTALGRNGDGQVATVNSEIASEVSRDGNGNSGNINISTGSLLINNGGAISSEIFGAGNAGDIIINATDTVSIQDFVEGVLIDGSNAGFNSNIAARVLANATGNGGNIEINSKDIFITNQGSLDTSSFGIGNAGSITINATDTLLAENNGFIISNIGNALGALAIGEVGTISITAQDIILNSDSQIQAGAFSGATAEGSGSVSLTASESISFTGLNTGIFSNNDPGSFGNASDAILSAPLINLKDGAVVTSVNRGEGNGGNVIIEADNLSLENGNTISAATVSGTGGSVTLDIAENITLRDNNSLESNNLISARATEDANGGNININAQFIVAFPNQNNDIVADAEQGQGGNITINAESLFGISEGVAVAGNGTNDIDASSEFSLDGNVTINTPDINPIQGVTELPSNIVVPEQTTAQACRANREIAAKNGLTIKGKGGVPPAPELPLISQNITINGKSVNNISTTPQPIETSQGKIQPARGIKVWEDGKITLTAYRTNNSGERLPEVKSNCGTT